MEGKRIRRIRPTTASKLRTRIVDEPFLNKTLSIIAENNTKIAELQKQQRDAEAVMLKAMKANRLLTWEVPGAEASVVIPQGRASRFIDPKEYFKLVTKDDFFESIKVSSEQAKKNLSEKELAKISTVTPGKPGEPTLEVKYR